MKVRKIVEGDKVIFVLEDYGRETRKVKMSAVVLSKGPVDISFKPTAWHYRHFPDGTIIETDGPNTAYRLL